VAHVTFLSRGPNVVFHVHASDAGADRADGLGEFRALCTTPCNAALPVGSHRFALSRPDDDSITRAEGDLVVRDGDTVVGTYESHAGTRTAGIAVVAVGSLGGAGLMVAAFFVGRQQVCSVGQGPGGAYPDCHRDYALSWPMFLGGLVLVLVGTVPGGLLAAGNPDRVKFWVEPGIPAGPALQRGESPSTWGAATGKERAAGFGGFTATWRF
jgi:hypothetical protein